MENTFLPWDFHLMLSPDTYVLESLQQALWSSEQAL